MADLYEDWCRDKRAENGRKTLWRLIEHEGVRDDVLEELSGRVLHHYVSDEEIAAFIEALGYPEAADSIRGLLPGPFHRRDMLHVAGHTLPPGFHWDVSVQGNAKTITTPTERWEVSRYINIAPDAHPRGRTPYARKIGMPN